MTPAPDPTFFSGVGFDPASWRGHTFDLYQGSTWLVALPPTIGLTGDLGLDDPYTYDRPPGGGDAEWFRRGRGQQKTRPLLTLGGTWVYRTVDEAVAHVAQIETALLTADQLTLQGKVVALLRTDFPQTCKTRNGVQYVEVTYAITLQTVTRVTRETLRTITGTPSLPTPGGDGAAQWGNLWP